MKGVFKTLMMAVIVLGVACTGQAQDKEKDDKIKIKITREIDGKKETLEKEYASVEEMKADPEFRKFSKSDYAFDFDFDFGDDFRSVIRMRDLAIDPPPSPQVWMFNDDDHDIRIMAPHPKVFRFKEEHQKELEATMKELEEKLANLDEELQADIKESLRELEELHMRMGGPKFVSRSSLSIGKVEDGDFGKRGKVSAGEELEIDDLDVHIMNQNLGLRFRLKDKGELGISISNEAGKTIYSQYFEDFDGRFADNIDFGKYKEGKYLLEIKQGKKRWVRKIEFK